MESIGEKMRNISDKNSRNSENLWLGILTGVFSLAWLANPHTWRGKDL